MGLENYGMGLHDGVYHEETLACLELNGVKRYVTGLNEFAPEVKRLAVAEREQKIKEIRSVVSQLEKDLAANVVDPEDKEFWNKLTLLKPDNDKFWSRISIKCGNDPVFLDPYNDPTDICRAPAGALQISACIANDVVYENMDLYINGEGSESNKKRATQTFIEAARSKMEDLKIRALVKDCLYYKFITTKASGWIETLDSSVKLGKRPDECVAFLKNPENEEALTSLLDKVEPYWNA